MSSGNKFNDGKIYGKLLRLFVASILIISFLGSGIVYLSASITSMESLRIEKPNSDLAPNNGGNLSKREIPAEITNQLESYLLAVYYVLESITTVGFGDIHPVKITNLLISILLQIMGVLFYGFVSKQINSFINSMRSWNISIKNERERIDAWLMVRQSNVFHDDKYGAFTRVRNYLNHQLSNDYRRLINDHRFLILHPSNQNKYIQDLCPSIALRFASFFKCISYEDSLQIIKLLELKVYLANQEVQKSNHQSLGLYLVKSGTAQVMHGSNENTTILNYREGSFFGENCLLRKDNPSSIK